MSPSNQKCVGAELYPEAELLFCQKPRRPQAMIRRGTVLNLRCQFRFSSLEIRHFEPHFSLCLGVFVLKNQFVFSPENP
jgi:hypothetical protein